MSRLTSTVIPYFTQPDFFKVSSYFLSTQGFMREEKCMEKFKPVNNAH